MSEARAFRFPAPVTGLAFTDDGAAAFACGDGFVRFAGAGDPVPVRAHQGAILAIAADPDGDSVLTGGDDGRLVRVQSDGSAAELLSFPGRWVEHVAASAETGAIAAAVGREVHLLTRKGARVLGHPSTVGGLAFDGKGLRLAAAHYNGTALWWTKTDAPAKTFAWKGYHTGVTFSPDRRFLVSTMLENTLHGWIIDEGRDMRFGGYPGKVKSLSWAEGGRWLATGGAARAVLWPFRGATGPMGKAAMEIGPAVPEGVIVTFVAAHPEAPILAAALSNGAVWAAEMGSGQAEFVRDAGEGVISVLGWSPDGGLLALGDEQGYAALLPVV